MGHFWTSNFAFYKVPLFRTHNIKHILNVATGINIFREDKDIVEKKVELLDVPEQNIDKGGKTKTFQSYPLMINVPSFRAMPQLSAILSD